VIALLTPKGFDNAAQGKRSVALGEWAINKLYPARVAQKPWSPFVQPFQDRASEVSKNASFRVFLLDSVVEATAAAAENTETTSKRPF